jgi:anti-sigma B factor antagonist
MLGELQVQSRAVRLTLHGELDLVTVETLRELLAEACDSDRSRVVIDLTDVPFVDVLSLSTILAAADGLRDRGAALSVAGASAAVRRVCALLNAEDVLEPTLPQQRLRAAQG